MKKLTKIILNYHIYFIPSYVQKCMQWWKWRKIVSLWRFELDAKRGPLDTGDFGEIGEIGGFGENRQRAGENGDKRTDPLETGDFDENRQRVGNIHNVANIQIGCHLKLAPSN